MEKFLGWECEEIKSLLSFILERHDISRMEIFKKWAKENCRDMFSVRNFFYKLKNKSLNKTSFLGFNKTELNKIFCLDFGKVSSKKLLQNILPVSQKSVRAVCLGLAKNNLKLMTCYQNKYRNLLKNNKKEVLETMKELEKNGIKTRNPYNNIIQMKSKSTKLTEGDIKNLFMGLVRLIKRNAEEEVLLSLKQEAEFANTTLQNALVDLRRNKLLVEELKDENKKLKQEFLLVKNNLAKSEAQNLSNMMEVQNLAYSERMTELKKFLSSLNLKENQNT